MENIKDIAILCGTAKRKSHHDCNSVSLKENEFTLKAEFLQNVTPRDFGKLRDPQLFARKIKPHSQKLTTRSSQLLFDSLKPYANITFKENKNVNEEKYDLNKNCFLHGEIIKGEKVERKMQFFSFYEETLATYSSFSGYEMLANLNDSLVTVKSGISNSFNIIPASDSNSFQINFQHKKDFNVGFTNLQKAVSSSDFINNVLLPKEQSDL